LTAKNCKPKDLRKTLAEMTKAFKRLNDLKAWPAVGFIKSTEITKSKNGDAHPHFHILLMVKSSYFSHGYISTQTWAEMWQQCLRSDYLPIVDIRAIKPKNKTDNFSGADLQSAVVETLKYATKPQDSFFDAEWLYTITEQLKGLRFLASGGVLKDILKENLTDEEMIHTDDDLEKELEPQKQLFLFGWKTAIKKYQKIN
jgi:plasmid rolling circle replication initiator protein Rep